MDIHKSSRFKDASWFPKKETVCLVGGAGGIGSWLTVMLARAGFLPMVFDYDLIEEHNMGGQLFPSQAIGLSKVSALAKVAKDFTATEILTRDEKITEETMSDFFVFSAFDNMKARTDMFNSWKEVAAEWLEDPGDDPEPIFIDGRLTMEQMQIFCVTPDKIKEYEEHLFDDSEVPDAPCTLKQTSHSAAMIASHMTAFFTNHFSNISQGERDRNIPFLWEYFIPIDYLNRL